ncbi:MAG TPA: LysM peptidoglycan-binding domain-containing protein [Acidimicrobiales bacterium]|jgi:LysM repeat protein|nr:LysM peptidoglycan-binding domain-containing protein [Acidimicrobiales bacterium]
MRYQVRIAVAALGVSLAVVPAACGFGGDDGGNEADASDSTAFRTITVQIETTTTTPAVVVSGGGTVAPSGQTYEVQQGDYWIGIAEKLNVGLNELLAVNNATTDTVIVPGQTIAIPAGASSLPPSEGGATGTSQPNDGSTGTYQIQAGDYWIKIAEDLEVPLQDLLNANNATTDTVLIPGEYIRVPEQSG